MKKHILILSFSLLMLAAPAQTKLIYVGDAMCSWCYGFAPEITKVKAHFAGRMEFELINGGLRPYGKETMGELASFFNEHWKEIEKRSGQPFSYGILQQKELIYDTELAARAVVVCRKLDPAKEFEYFKTIQKKFYHENKNPNNIQTYVDIAALMQLDTAKFVTLYNSDEIKKQTAADFKKAAAMGVQGFPAVLVVKDEKIYVVANGYTEAKTIIKTIEKLSVSN